MACSRTLRLCWYSSSRRIFGPNTRFVRDQLNQLTGTLFRFSLHIGRWSCGAFHPRSSRLASVWASGFLANDCMASLPAPEVRNGILFSITQSSGTVGYCVETSPFHQLFRHTTHERESGWGGNLETIVEKIQPRPARGVSQFFNHRVPKPEIN